VIWTGAGRRVGALGLAALLLGVSRASGQDVDVSEVGYTLGEPDAPVTVVEFGDFACSACAEFWRDTWPRVRTELIETGRVVWRHVPFLLGFARGDEAARAAECAGEQGRFWPMHDRLFTGQREWTRGRHPEEVFARYAADIGVGREEFEACLRGDGGEARTRAATKAARAAGVRGTPTFFIDGRQAVGALPFEMFLELVERAERGGAGTESTRRSLETSSRKP
jgi:protein-disulfide isomerase